MNKFIFLTGLLVLSSCNWTEPKFKEGDCVKDKLHWRPRLIVDITSFNYYYILLDKNKDIRRMMRIKYFNNLMKKIDCPEEE